MRSRIDACRDVFSRIRLLAGGRESTATIIPDDTSLWHLEVLALETQSPIHFFCDWSRLRIDLKYQRITVAGLIDKSDFIVEKTGGWQAEPYMLATVKEARTAFEEKKEAFDLAGKVSWPDGGQMTIYQRKKAR
jgi:hypothetical protein